MGDWQSESSVTSWVASTAASTVADAAAEMQRRVRWRGTFAWRPWRARVNPAAFRVAVREGRPATQARRFRHLPALLNKSLAGARVIQEATRVRSWQGAGLRDSRMRGRRRKGMLVCQFLVPRFPCPMTALKTFPLEDQRHSPCTQIAISASARSEKHDRHQSRRTLGAKAARFRVLSGALRAPWPAQLRSARSKIYRRRGPRGCKNMEQQGPPA